MNKALLILGGAGAVAYTQYRDFTLFKDALTFRVQNVRLNQSQTGLQQISLTADIAINNPRDYKVTAQSMQLILAFNNQPVTTVFRGTPFVIEPLKTTNVQVTFIVPFSTGVPSVVAMFNSFINNLTLQLTVAGVIRFALLDVKFATPFKLI